MEQQDFSLPSKTFSLTHTLPQRHAAGLAIADHPLDFPIRYRNRLILDRPVQVAGATSSRSGQHSLDCRTPQRFSGRIADAEPQRLTFDSTFNVRGRHRHAKKVLRSVSNFRSDRMLPFSNNRQTIAC
jgi:hypothetical protein